MFAKYPNAFRLGLAAALAAAVAGCATTPAADDPVLIKISELERRLSRVETKLENDSLIEIVGQVQTLSEDMRLLRGAVEGTQNDMDGVRQRQRELFLQIDDRLAKLESRPVAAAPVAEGGTPGDASLGEGASDGEIYNAAFELLKDRRYDEARQGFLQVVEQYPGSTLASAARYWAAECLYVSSDFGGALAEFAQVVSDYPASAKVPDALLKIGYSQYELGAFGDARSALEQVTQQFPDTTAARLADERLTRMRREGN